MLRSLLYFFLQQLQRISKWPGMKWVIELTIIGQFGNTTWLLHVFIALLDISKEITLSVSTWFNESLELQTNSFSHFGFKWLSRKKLEARRKSEYCSWDAVQVLYSFKCFYIQRNSHIIGMPGSKTFILYKFSEGIIHRRNRERFKQCPQSWNAVSSRISRILAQANGIHCKIVINSIREKALWCTYRISIS